MKHLLLTSIAALVLVGTAFADPIHDAAESGDLAGVQAELDKGADVNAKDYRVMTPLHYAAANGHKEIAELLIAEGADVNAKEDEYGITPLHEAAFVGYKEIAELLIAKGGDVNAKDVDGETPLDAAESLNEDVPPEDKAAKKETADFLRKHGGKTGEELK